MNDSHEVLERKQNTANALTAYQYPGASDQPAVAAPRQFTPMHGLTAQLYAHDAFRKWPCLDGSSVAGHSSQPYVRQRRDGRWKAYLHDSITNQKLCLGSYATFEEASRVANDYAARQVSQVPRPLSPSSALKQMDITTPRSRSRPHELATCTPLSRAAQPIPTVREAAVHAPYQQQDIFDSSQSRSQRARRHSDTHMSSKMLHGHPWVQTQVQPQPQPQPQPWLIPHADQRMVAAAGSTRAGAGHAFGHSGDPAASWVTEEALAREGVTWNTGELPLVRCSRQSKAPGSSHKQRAADPESSGAATTFAMAGSSSLAAGSDAFARCRLSQSSPALAAAAALQPRQPRRPSSRYDSSSSSAECSGQHSCSSSPERPRRGSAAASQLPESLSLGSEVPLSPFSLSARQQEELMEAGGRQRAAAAPAHRPAAAPPGMRRSSSCADVGKLQLARLTAASADSQVSALQAQLAAAEANAAKQKLLLQQQLAEARLAAKTEQRRLKVALMAAGDATGGHTTKPLTSPRKRPPPLDSILEQPCSISEQPRSNSEQPCAPYLHRLPDSDTHAPMHRGDDSRLLLQSPNHSLPHSRCPTPSPQSHAVPRAPRPHRARASPPLHSPSSVPLAEEASFNDRDLAAAHAQPQHYGTALEPQHSHKQSFAAAAAPAPAPAPAHHFPAATGGHHRQPIHYPTPQHPAQHPMQHAMQYPAPHAMPYQMQHPMQHAMQSPMQYMPPLPMHWYPDATCEPRAGAKPQKKRRHSAIPVPSAWASPHGCAPLGPADEAGAVAASATQLGKLLLAAGSPPVPVPAAAAHRADVEGRMHMRAAWRQAEAGGLDAAAAGSCGQEQGMGRCGAQTSRLGAAGPRSEGAVPSAQQDPVQPGSPGNLGCDLSQLLKSFLQESEPELSSSGGAGAAAAAGQAPCSSTQLPAEEAQPEASGGSLGLFAQYSSFLDSGAGAEAEIAAGAALLGADDTGQLALSDLGTWLDI